MADGLDAGDDDTQQPPPRPGGRSDAARRQRDKLVAFQSDRAGRHLAVEGLVERRSRAAAPLRFYMPDAEGPETLPVESELLVETESLTREASVVLSEQGLVPQPVECLRGLVARIVQPGASKSELRRLRDSLRNAGATVALTYVIPSGVVIKSGLSTPERVYEPSPTGPTVDTQASGRVGVLLVDTGISSLDRSDGWLEGLEKRDARHALDVTPPNGYLDAAAGHGTFVAGLYQQGDAGLALIPKGPLDGDGFASEVDVACAIVTGVEDQLEEGGRLVVNLSLGTETEPEDPAPLALTAALSILREVESARSGEVLVVAAAGNEGTDEPCWPGAFAADDDMVVAVGALNADGAPASWSTRGEWVTCSAPGEAVMSTFVHGREDPAFDPKPERFGRNAWALWTGTSFTAPQVGAAVARSARLNGTSLRQALDDLLAGKPTAPGYGALLTGL